MGIAEKLFHTGYAVALVGYVVGLSTTNYKVGQIVAICIAGVGGTFIFVSALVAIRKS